jgi:hypothetical protein
VLTILLLFQIPVPIVFRGPNGAAAGVAAQRKHPTLDGEFICKFQIAKTMPHGLLIAPV